MITPDRFDIDVLMPWPMMPTVIDQLGAAFRLHRLWEEADPQAALRALSPSVRAIASGLSQGARIDAALFDALPKLEIISSFGVGYDHIDALEAGRRGLIVTNTPDVLDEEVADTTIGLLLATLRQLPQADRYLRAGHWLKSPFPLTESLQDRSVGVVGMGRIGQAIARRLAAFNRPIAYHSRRPVAGLPYRHYPVLTELASAVDVLIVITPGGPATRHLINAEVLAALGPRGVLINVARGSVVDEAALVAALQSGAILSAGLDVFADEPRVPQALIDMEHVVLLPHVGSASRATRHAMAQLVVDNLLAWAGGKPPLTPVPETPVKG